MATGTRMTRQGTVEIVAGWRSMRAILIAILMLGGLHSTIPVAQAGSFQADGSYAGAPSAAVAALFAANPNGGDGLVNAIRTLLLANPELADDVAYLASRGSAAQQDAAAAGMAQAFTVLTQRGNATGAARIVSAAQLSGNSIIQTAMIGAVGRTTVYADQSTNPVTGKTNCQSPVSAAAPPPC